MFLKRILPLLLVLSMLVVALAACGGGDSGETKKRETKETSSSSETSSGQETDKWAGVSFGGTDLKVSISANQDSECTFPAADIYTMGPDEVGTDNVQKMVYNRNRDVSSRLDLNVIYETTDLSYDLVLEDIQKKVRLDPGDAPDIYNNDIYGLLRGMLEGDFCNVVVPELGEQSYFDFEDPAWHWDYMLGTSFYPEKIYLLAGDYFIDLIRMAWVLYVNIDEFDNNLINAFGDIEALYDLVLDGEWDFDTLNYFIELAYRDTGAAGTVEEDDELLGFAGNSVMQRVFSWTSGLSLTEFDEDGEPHLRQTLPDFYELSKMYSSLYNTDGVLVTTNVLHSTELFLNGNVLFAMSVLGEMESEQVRQVANLNKGMVPYPKYDLEQQEKYHTLVHDQAEIAAIMTTTTKFTEATAWLQMVNEESTAVLHEYYENSLKLKYNDSPKNKRAIDLIHDTIDSPFESLIMNYMAGQSTAGAFFEIMQYDAKNQADKFNSTYETNYTAYKAEFDELVDLFKEMK